MGAFTTDCPRCSTQNEVDTDILPRGASLISCWHCATQINVSQEVIADATKQPSAKEVERKETAAVRSSSSSLPATKDKAAPRKGGGGILKAVAAVVGALILGLVVVGGVITLFSRSSDSLSSSRQFREAYHTGSAQPSGSRAWDSKIPRGSGFAPARFGETIFVVANEPITAEAEDFTPEGVPEELLDPLRTLYAKMLVKGFVQEKMPQTTALQLDQNERFTVKLLKGSCYQFVAMGGEKVRDLDLLLYHSDGVRLIIADTLGQGNAKLGHCPVKTTDYIYEIRMREGRGLVSHVVYRELETAFHGKGSVYALNVNNGTQRWSVSFEEEIASSPAATEQFLVVGTRTRKRSSSTRRITEGGSLQVISPGDGSSLCSYQTVGPAASSPTIFDKMAYFGSCGEPRTKSGNTDLCSPQSQAASKLYAFNLENCSVLWSFDTGHPIAEPPSVVDDSIFFTSGEKVIALDRLEGTKQWEAEAHGSTSAPVSDGSLVVFGAPDGSLRAVNASTGEIRWVFESDAPMLATPAIVESLVFSGNSDGNIYAIDVASGEKYWDMSVGSPVVSPIAAAAQLVFVLAGDQLFAVDAEQGATHFDFQLDAATSQGCSPILSNGTLVFSDGGGNVYGLR